MIWLLVSVLCNAGFVLLFKLFARKNISIFPAVVFNYITCFICGNILLGEQNIFSAKVWENDWFFRIAPLGFLFIITFNLLGLGTRMAGAAAVSVASKMSVVLPVLVAIFLFGEPLNWLQYAGMGLSLLSVYLVAPETASEKRNHRGLIVLALVFLGSGLVDTGLNLIKHEYGNRVSDDTSSTLMFGCAGLVGTIIGVIGFKKIRVSWKEIAGGIALGLINYLSLIALFKALDSFKGKTALFFAVNNIGVVLASSIFAVILFQERIGRRERIGLLIAVVAILLMHFHAVFG